MADTGIVKTYLSALDQTQQRVFKTVFDYILADIRFGRGTDGDPSQNLGGGFFSGTTPHSANEEFTIAHTFGRTPYLLIPVLPLDQVNATIPRLTVSRAADANRIYLKSADTDAPFFVYLEG